MTQKISPLAGKPAPASILTDIAGLLAAYYDRQPDWSVAGERVAFGTSGHRGTSLNGSFNENHVLAITQAVCDYRRTQDINGPLFLGIDTHALSHRAFETALEVLAANGITVMVAKKGEFTPTPAISHAILAHNRGREAGLADGIVMTPSHNPPGDGGYKYNPPHGGPAESPVTDWIGERANAHLKSGLEGVRRVTLSAAEQAATTQEHDYLNTYVADLGDVVDFEVIRHAGIRMGVDPLGGAGVHYWAAIAERYELDLTVISEALDPQFAFMSVDWDGQIRMDPSSPYAMQRLIGMKDSFDVGFACDTDHDRHGIVTRSSGLMPPNHYLSVLADTLLGARPNWPQGAGLGKTVVTTAMLERVASRADRPLYEVPVGFKWFAQGLHDATLVMGCEESAGASVLRRNGNVWTTDKDGIVPALLSAEITARTGRDPGALYAQLEGDLGCAYADRIEASASPAQKRALSKLDADDLQLAELAGEAVTAVISRAPGNNEAIGGIKAMSKNGWFAARPSGTEDIYKIYAESFRDEAHLRQLVEEAQQIVDQALSHVAGNGETP